MFEDLSQIIGVLTAGGIIIYPTESVMGIGCDPFNETAVMTLLKIKQRDINKGMILLASDWQQLQPYIQHIDADRMAEIQASKNITWLFPKTEQVPDWVSGEFDSVAVRVSGHPLAKRICEQFGKPIISTSANLSDEPPTKDYHQLSFDLTQKVDAIIEADCGELTKPTQIRDAITDAVIR